MFIVIFYFIPQEADRGTARRPVTLLQILYFADVGRDISRVVDMR